MITNRTNFSGDVSGTYNALTLGNDTVGTNEVINNSLTGDDLSFTTGTTTIDARYVNVTGDTMTLL